MKIDPSKKYQTRDGMPVTHLHRAPEGWPSGYPWRGVVGGGSQTWDDDGRALTADSECPSDLVEVREPLEVDIVVNGKGEVWGIRGASAEWYDNYSPEFAPFRIATFREVMP